MRRTAVVVVRRARGKLPEVRELTPDEGRELFAQEVRRILNIEPDEFVRRWAAGEYGDPDTTNPDIWSLVMLLPTVGVSPWR
jgi:hypothetical protein